MQGCLYFAPSSCMCFKGELISELHEICFEIHQAVQSCPSHMLLHLSGFHDSSVLAHVLKLVCPCLLANYDNSVALAY